MKKKMSNKPDDYTSHELAVIRISEVLRDLFGGPVNHKKVIELVEISSREDLTVEEEKRVKDWAWTGEI